MVTEKVPVAWATLVSQTAAMGYDGLFLTLGALFAAALVLDQIGRRTRLPRVTLLLLGGVAAGPSGLALIPQAAAEWYEFFSIAALTMVAFLLGSGLTVAELRAHGRVILVVSLAIVVVTAVGVSVGLALIGVALVPAVLLGAIATATAPAGTTETIHESGVTGPFPDMLRGIVAVDDAWGLLVFSLAVVAAGMLNGAPADDALVHAVYEILGGGLLGVLIGVPAAFVTGRISTGEPLQIEAVALVFLTAGLALWLGVSFLIAGMTAGSVIANLARHHSRAFHEIEHIRLPFLLLFFLLAGAALEVAVLGTLGLVGLTYVLLRSLTRLAGGWIGAVLARVPRPLRPWFGPALLPQAGVAVGMALVASQRFPEYADMLLTLTIGTTVVFELIGPVFTLMALRRVAAQGNDFATQGQAA